MSLIRLADNSKDGVCALYVRAEDAVGQEPREVQRKLLQRVFMLSDVFLHDLAKSDALLERIDAKSHQVDEDAFTVTFNLAKLLMLPGQNPGAEIDEFRGFLMATRPFFDDVAGQGNLQVTNHNDEAQGVHGKISCRTLKDGTTPQEPAELNMQHEARIDALVQASPVLSAFVQNVANALQDRGPYGWWTIEKRDIYPNGYAPTNARTSQEVIEQAQAASAVVEAEIASAKRATVRP